MQFANPPLRISNVVKGRRRDAQRVTYFVDVAGIGPNREIAEGVVLRRWKARKRDGFHFNGGRLPPSTWRALPMVLGNDIAQWSTFSEAEIAEKKERALPMLRSALLKVPSARTIAALVLACGAERLRQLVERHKDDITGGSPGVPDLFLFATGPRTRDSIYRFVEVKKPEEGLLPSQKNELKFLISLGLSAQVLELIER